MSLPEPEPADPLRLRDVRPECGVPDFERERDRDVWRLPLRLRLRLLLRLLLLELARWSSICKLGEFERESSLPLYLLCGVPLRDREREWAL